MIRHALFPTVLAAVLILSAGCGAQPVQVSPPEQVNLVASDNGGKVTLFAGQELIIQLSGNPSTGYILETKDLEASMFMQVGDTKFTSSNPNLVGSGGTQTLTLRILKTGTTTLTLVYHRPWETDVKPVNTFSVKVTVK